MKCATCGRVNSDTAKFCGGCGTALIPVEAGSQPLGAIELPMMSFSTAVETCFRKYVDFKGRATRAEYWWFSLFMALGATVASGADAFVLGNPFETTGLIEVVFHLGTLLPSLAVGVRRLHDIKKSGWWLLLFFTIVGAIPLIIWAIRQGDAGENQYGADPRQAPLG